MQRAKRAIDPLIERSKVVVCVGAGGVGKTTVSAAIAIRAALGGRKTALLTIDPAKRLVDALDVQLDDTLRPIAEIEHDRLHAAMLDAQESSDRLIRRISPDEQTAARIFASKAYRLLSGSAARAHAYVALERLLEVVESNEFELIVVDTPPSDHALDILDAPRRLAALLDERTVGWLLGALRPQAAPLVQIPMLHALHLSVSRMLGVLWGRATTQEILDFFEACLVLRPGFSERCARIESLLRDRGTSAVLVAGATAAGLDRAKHVSVEFERRDIRLASVLFNRSRPKLSISALGTPISGSPELQDLLNRLTTLFEAEHQDRIRSAQAISRFFAASRIPKGIVIPTADVDFDDVHALTRFFAGSQVVERDP